MPNFTSKWLESYSSWISRLITGRLFSREDRVVSTMKWSSVNREINRLGKFFCSTPAILIRN